VVKRLIVAIALVTGTIGGVLAAPAGASIRSTLGAGYLQTPNVGVSVAETEIRIPTITCANSNDTEQLWLGAQGYSGPTGSGSFGVYAQVLAECVNGAISYTAYADIPGQSAQSAAVTPGWVVDFYFRESSSSSVATIDRIKPSITQLVDMVGGPVSDESVLIGQQDLAAVVPTFTDPKTGTHNIYFLASYVNGYEMKYDTYPTEELVQANQHVEVGTSALSTGNKFHLVFKSNY
jgi:hypothetical protein